MNSQHSKNHSITRIHTQVPKRLLSNQLTISGALHSGIKDPLMPKKHIPPEKWRIEMAHSTKSC